MRPKLAISTCRNILFYSKTGVNLPNNHNKRSAVCSRRLLVVLCKPLWSSERGVSVTKRVLLRREIKPSNNRVSSMRLYNCTWLHKSFLETQSVFTVRPDKHFLGGTLEGVRGGVHARKSGQTNGLHVRFSHHETDRLHLSRLC